MDHNPIELKIQVKVPQPPPSIITKINCTQFQTIINNVPTLLPEINYTNDTENFIRSITNEIKDLLL